MSTIFFCDFEKKYLFFITLFYYLSNMKKNYNEILKKSVEESGFTHREIGEKIGESQQTISNWLNKNDISLLKFIPLS